MNYFNWGTRVIDAISEQLKLLISVLPKFGVMDYAIAGKCLTAKKIDEVIKLLL